MNIEATKTAPTAAFWGRTGGRTDPSKLTGVHG